MKSEFDFEIVPSDGEITFPKRNSDTDIQGKEHLADAIADNFERVLDIATSIVEIEKINAQTNAYVSILEEKRKNLIAEADAYVKRVNADTQATVSKVEIIQRLMQDYYQSGKNTMNSEDFSRIISEIIVKMGDI